MKEHAESMLQQAVSSKGQRFYSLYALLVRSWECIIVPAFRASEDQARDGRSGRAVGCQLFLRSVSGVLPDTYHFRVKGSSVTRERLNQLTTSCQFRFNFTWLSWRKPVSTRHACHATFSEFIGR